MIVRWSSPETLWRSALGTYGWGTSSCCGLREVEVLAYSPRHTPPLPPQVCLKYYEYEFMELACQCPAVVCCRCAPTQKAQIVRLLQERTGKLTCAVGKPSWGAGGIPGEEEPPGRESGLLGWQQSWRQALLALSRHPALQMLWTFFPWEPLSSAVVHSDSPGLLA